MAKLNEEASSYEAPTTKNIADLESVSVELEVADRTGKGQDGEEFKYKVVIVDGVDYRVPGSVLGSLKEILKSKPTLKTFKVSKQGQGMNTKYFVIPLE